MITYLIIDRQQCSGCAACVQKCPQKCISLHEDNEGFLYPLVDKKTCIDCGLCSKVCPVLTPNDTRMPLKVLAAINKNEKIRLASSSGGIFTLLAEKVILEGGVVFGARFDEEWQVKLDYTETVEGLSAFRGSKYVQAQTGDTFKQCELFLKKGRKVLFTGTPCQISGLHHFLGKEYETLITCDFVCHGVPSPKVWRMYLNEVISGATKAIKDIEFRNKDNGWKAFNFKMSYRNDNRTIVLSSNAADNHFMRAFLRDLILRPSCYDCKMKQCRSKSDVTIADFWGVGNFHPEIDDDKGTGLVLLHTHKVISAIDWNSLVFTESNFENAIVYNPSIIRSCKPHKNRSKFFASLDSTNNIANLIIEQTQPSFLKRVKLMVKHSYSEFKRIVKSIMGGGKVIGLQNDSACILHPGVTLDSIESISFRDKIDGWKTYRMSISIISK